MKGKREEAAKSLALLRGKKLDEVKEELEEIAISVDEQMSRKTTSWKTILVRPVDRRALIISQLISAVNVISGVFVIWNYATQLFTETHETFCLQNG